jgi:hypothetical protein
VALGTVPRRPLLGLSPGVCPGIRARAFSYHYPGPNRTYVPLSDAFGAPKSPQNRGRVREVPLIPGTHTEALSRSLCLPQITHSQRSLDTYTCPFCPGADSATVRAAISDLR